MNIGIVGGGGVRSPIIIKMLAEYDPGRSLNEVRILDVDDSKTNAILRLSSAILNRLNKRLNVVRYNSISEFSQKLDLAIFTIREGFEEGRAIDERICLRHNIIGQETTGAAGFAFASRTVPVLIKYAREIKRHSPACILINFTNPAGIVVRALNLAGITDVIGICDSSDAARIHASQLLKMNRWDLDATIAGLNHLSWTTQLLLKGENILPSLMNDERFYELAHGPFTKELFGMNMLFKNEYLYYYYCTASALKGMLEERETRGEYLLRRNRELVRDLRQEGDESKLIEIYDAYLNDRCTTYMSYAYGKGRRRLTLNESEGYAEIALNVASAMLGKKEVNIPLVLPNNGTLPFLPDSMVVEKFCYIRNGRIESKGVWTELPAFERSIIERVSRYEDLTARSILDRSFSEAIEAMKVHPLIGEGVAADLLKEFVEAHREYFKDYR